MEFAPPRVAIVVDKKHWTRGDHRAQWHLRHCGSRRRSRQLDLRRRQRQRPR
ncbi:hypothetical protein IE992_03500 [Klebsiella pneumoniae]|uniref:Uncharacterized protein n=1 Tax=Klebsiella pneumoniae TaxID=573 RepID=A0A927DXH3_KLEPN|nr:hypothetical protein [Klebsiella pneumoniae]